MNKLLELPKEKLVEIIEKLYANLVKEPKYDIYSKSFFIEFLKQMLEVYKRYKNIKLVLLVFKFDETKIVEIKKHLRKSDLIAKYDNAFVILLSETGNFGAYKVKNKLEKILGVKGEIIDINIKEGVKEVLKDIENKIKLY